MADRTVHLIVTRTFRVEVDESQPDEAELLAITIDATDVVLVVAVFLAPPSRFPTPRPPLTGVQIDDRGRTMAEALADLEARDESLGGRVERAALTPIDRPAASAPAAVQGEVPS